MHFTRGRQRFRTGECMNTLVLVLTWLHSWSCTGRAISAVASPQYFMSVNPRNRVAGKVKPAISAASEGLLSRRSGTPSGVTRSRRPPREMDAPAKTEFKSSRGQQRGNISAGNKYCSTS